jgi:hypothetical protein
VVLILHRTIQEHKMTVPELLKKAEELERIARELRAMTYVQGLVTEESTEPSPEGGKTADNNSGRQADHVEPRGV